MHKKAIILAGGRGTRCGNIPKMLLKINGESLIQRQVRLLNSLGINNICVVTGAYSKSLMHLLKNVNFVYNPRFKLENSYSLKCGIKNPISKNDIIITTADIIYDKSLLSKVINTKGSTYAVDINGKINTNDYGVVIKNKKIIDFNRASNCADIGIIKIEQKNVSDLYNRLDGKKSCGFYFLKYNLNPVYVSKNEKWYEIDTIEDYNRAKKLFTLKFTIDDKVNASEILNLIQTMDFAGFHLESRNSKREKQALANSISLSIRDSNKLIGYLRIFGDKNYYWGIWDVMVHPDYQGIGLGKTLIKEAIKYIKQFNPIKIFLFSAKDKKSFYKQFGFNKSRADVLEIRND